MNKTKVLNKIKDVLISLLQIIAFIDLIKGRYVQSLILMLFVISLLMIDMISNLEMIRKIKTLNYREKHFKY